MSKVNLGSFTSPNNSLKAFFSFLVVVALSDKPIISFFNLPLSIVLSVYLKSGSFLGASAFWACLIISSIRSLEDCWVLPAFIKVSTVLLYTSSVGLYFLKKLKMLLLFLKISKVLSVYVTNLSSNNPFNSAFAFFEPPLLVLFSISRRLLSSPLAKFKLSDNIFFLPIIFLFVIWYFLKTSCNFCWSITSPTSPSTKILLISFIKFVLFVALIVLSATSWATGKTPSIALVILSTNSSARAASFIFKPFFTTSDLKSSLVKGPPGVNGSLIYLLINLSNLELLYAKSFPRLARVLMVVPTPYAKGVTNKDSVPNLTLFINFLAASLLPL